MGSGLISSSGRTHELPRACFPPLTWIAGRAAFLGSAWGGKVALDLGLWSCVISTALYSVPSKLSPCVG